MVHGIRNPGRRHRDSSVFRRPEKRLCEAEGVFPKATMKRGRPNTGLTPANKDVITAAVESTAYRARFGNIKSHRLLGAS